jgi:NADH:ubiquinone oxidoreductase subunit K
LALVAAGYAGGVVQIGQSVAVTLIVADTIVAVVGLALAMQIRRRMGTLDVSELSSLRG